VVFGWGDANGRCWANDRIATEFGCGDWEGTETGSDKCRGSRAEFGCGNEEGTEGGSGVVEEEYRVEEDEVPGRVYGCGDANGGLG